MAMHTAVEDHTNKPLKASHHKFMQMSLVMYFFFKSYIQFKTK